MAENWALKGVSRDDERVEPGSGDAPVSAPRLSPAAAVPRGARVNLVSIAVGVIGLAALGASAWVYAQTQRDIKRVSTDIAQIRLSLELFGRQQSTGGGPTSTSDAGLLELSNRVALLEAGQSSGGGVSAASALPAVSANVAASPAAATDGDCLPVGMRFMVSSGDSYPVCGTTGTVAIASVDQGYVTLTDGSVIAEGGTINLAGTQCMVGVMPNNGDGLSGFAEIRVAC
ncbi:MAG: hypothetical protein ACOH2N_17080 [Devosia sp.]